MYLDSTVEDKNGKPVNPGNRAKETEGINKQRSHLVNTTAKLAKETSPEEEAVIGGPQGPVGPQGPQDIASVLTGLAGGQPPQPGGPVG